MASSSCLPWFHTAFAGVPNLTINSGCAIASNGNIPCDPDAMRANAEAQLQASGYLSSLDLETYTLARYMQGEVGNGSVEERVAVGEAAVNRAKMEGTSINGLLLYRQPQGHPNRGYYGPIHGIGTGTSTAPYGRWATTAADPTLLTLLLADLITSGDSDDYANGADDQDGPEAWISQGQGALTNYVRGLAAKGKYWVGPIPGIDPWRTFLQFTPGVSASSSEGQALLQRGISALTLPAQRPNWTGFPVCPKPASGWLTAALITGLIVGAWGFTRGWGRYIGHRA